jgi:hypothetical protein
VTGRSAQPTRRATPGVRFESSKGPLVTGRVRSIMTGRAPRPIDLAICWPSRRLTGHVSPASDRTRRGETLACVPLQQLLLTGRAGPPWTTSGPTSDRSFLVINILDFCHLFSPPVQWKIGISFPRKYLNPALASSAGGREEPKPLSTAQTPLSSQMC